MSLQDTQHPPVSSPTLSPRSVPNSNLIPILLTALLTMGLLIVVILILRALLFAVLPEFPVVYANFVISIATIVVAALAIYGLTVIHTRSEDKRAQALMEQMTEQSGDLLAISNPENDPDLKDFFTSASET